MYITKKNKDYGYTGPAEFYENTTETVGEFVNGKLNGLAIVKDENQTTVAEFNDDTIEGLYATKTEDSYSVGITNTSIGTKILKDGSIFVGDWQDNNDVNYGVVYTDSGIFIGKIMNEIPVECDTGKWISKADE